MNKPVVISRSLSILSVVGHMFRTLDIAKSGATLREKYIIPVFAYEKSAKKKKNQGCLVSQALPT